jgi:hypothetical protein
MKESLKYFLERTTPFGILARLQRNRQLIKKLRKWEKSGAVLPMPNLGKQRVVIEYIKRFSIDTFIETGTYKGKMVYAVMLHMKEIYSIELDEIYFQKAKRKFAGYPNIHIIQGHSGEVLPKILKKIDKPCLFWLDAHWSGGSTAKGDIETPIMREMQCILGHLRGAEHVILIDDARCFKSESDYPTLKGLESFIRNFYPDCIFEVKDDIIRTYLNRH